MTKYTVEISGQFTFCHRVEAKHEDEAKEKVMELLNQSDVNTEINDVSVWETQS